MQRAERIFSYLSNQESYRQMKFPNINTEHSSQRLRLKLISNSMGSPISQVGKPHESTQSLHWLLYIALPSFVLWNTSKHSISLKKLRIFGFATCNVSFSNPPPCFRLTDTGNPRAYHRMPLCRRRSLPLVSYQDGGEMV